MGLSYPYLYPTDWKPLSTAYMSSGFPSILARLVQAISHVMLHLHIKHLPSRLITFSVIYIYAYWVCHYPQIGKQSVRPTCHQLHLVRSKLWLVRQSLYNTEYINCASSDAPIGGCSPIKTFALYPFTASLRPAR